VPLSPLSPALRKLPWGKACFVDVETTGLNSYRDEMVEIALVMVAFDAGTGEIRGVLDQYAGLREPAVNIHPLAARIHGIDAATVKGMRFDDQAVLRLIGKADFFVAHNAAFDRGFVTKMYPQAAAKPWLCSMQGINWRSYGFQSRRLPSLLAAHNITNAQSHRAGADVAGMIALLAHNGRDGKPYFYQLVQGLHRSS